MRCLCSYYTLFSMLSRRNQSSNFKRHRLHIWEHRRIHAFSAQHQLFPLSVLCSSTIFPSSIPTKPCSPSIRQYATPAYYISMLSDCCKTDPCLYLTKTMRSHLKVINVLTTYRARQRWMLCEFPLNIIVGVVKS